MAGPIPPGAVLYSVVVPSVACGVVLREQPHVVVSVMMAREVYLVFAAVLAALVFVVGLVPIAGEILVGSPVGWGSPGCVSGHYLLVTDGEPL